VPELRTSRPVDPDAERRALLARVRETGAQGGRIDPHRSIATMELGLVDVLIAIALAGAFVAVYVNSLRLVGEWWTRAFTWLAGPLGLHGAIGQRETMLASVPFFTAPVGPPGILGWSVGLLLTILAGLASIPMRGRWLPLGYALRFAVAIQATALLFFAAVPAHFPYGLAEYTGGMMAIGSTIIGLVPVLYGLTLYLMDIGWTRKALLTVLTMGHLLVLVPLQYALQAALIAHASLLVLPLCFIMFGMLPEVMVIVALFGWGMSWRPLRARGRRQ